MIASRASLAICACVVAAAIAPSAAAAQRRRAREPAAPPPVTLAIAAMPAREGAEASAFHRVLSVEAAAPIELVGDRRLLRFELRPEGARRTLHCEHPDRPSRMDPDRVVQLAAGERWEEWIDLREYCWGRALDALREGAELTAFYGPRRARRGHYVVRAPGEPAIDHRTLGPITLLVPPSPEPADPDPAAPLRVTLADRDARSGSGVSLRVGVVAREGRLRAYVRSDHFRFRVRAPDGTSFDCGMHQGGGAAAAELFQRLTTRSGPRFSLDASFYCEDDAFAAQGVYEVVPIVDVDQSGERWGLETPVGTFVGAPALVRVRRGAGGYVPRSPSAAPPDEAAGS